MNWIYVTVGILNNPKNYSQVEFETCNMKPDMIAVIVVSDEPSRLWLTTETARVVWNDLVKQGYIAKGV